MGSPQKSWVAAAVRITVAIALVWIATAAPSLAQPSAYGIVTHVVDEALASKASELGTGFVRISARWRQIEPRPGEFHWETLDADIWDRAAPRGLRLFVTIEDAPEWAGGGAAHNGAPNDLERWRHFVGAVVNRYKGYVKHWGIWNEPDSQIFLADRRAYRDIAREARRAIKAADAEALVLGPEVSEGALDDGWFAEVMSEWGFEIFDIVTVHIYNVRFGDKMDRLVKPWTFGKPVWLTEAGRTAVHGNALSEELQRQYFLIALQAFEARRWWWTKIFFYELRKFESEGYGIVRSDSTNTRAFDSYRDWIARTAPFTEQSDSDGDGLPDVWEGPLGFNVTSAQGTDGAGGDPDGDGVSNVDEYQRGTHPRGTFTRYLAEGASTPFFDTSIALLNLEPASPAHVLLRWLADDGHVTHHVVTVPPNARATVRAGDFVGQAASAFATVVESDAPLAVDRTMRWGGAAGGAHSEIGLETPSTQWFFAEGATHSGFSLFYLLQNPSDGPARVEVSYLRPAPAVPLVRRYELMPLSRLTIWVNQEDAQLMATDVSAAIVSDVPILAERAMYLAVGGVQLAAGHDSAGVTLPQSRWFLAEGATGSFFDLFYLIANPSGSDTQVRTSYLLPDGRTVTRTYPVARHSRFTVWVDHEDASLADTAVSAVIESLDGVPIVVERAMWWPGPSPGNWYEGHNSRGATETGTKWALAEGEQGGDTNTETFVLIANTGEQPGRASITLHFEDGTTSTRAIELGALSRTNVMIATAFPEAAGRRFGVVVESVGPTPQPIVVERANYASPGGTWWRHGTNALGTRLE